MKKEFLPMNLLYLAEEGYLISSGYLLPNQTIIGSVDENACFLLSEATMPWMQAKSYCAEISTAKLHYEMPTPQEMTNILRGRDLFNQTVAILQQNGIAAAPINGANYWTNAYDWCDCYFAIVQKTLQKKAYSGQTNLAFRAVLHLCPLTQK